MTELSMHDLSVSRRTHNAPAILTVSDLAQASSVANSWRAKQDRLNKAHVDALAIDSFLDNVDVAFR